MEELSSQAFPYMKTNGFLFNVQSMYSFIDGRLYMLVESSWSLFAVKCILDLSLVGDVVVWSVVSVLHFFIMFLHIFW